MALQEEAKLRTKSRLEVFPGGWRELTLEEWDNWVHNFSGKSTCLQKHFNDLRVLGAQLEVGYLVHSFG